MSFSATAAFTFLQCSSLLKVMPQSPAKMPQPNTLVQWQEHLKIDTGSCSYAGWSHSSIIRSPNKIWKGCYQFFSEHIFQATSFSSRLPYPYIYCTFIHLCLNKWRLFWGLERWKSCSHGFKGFFFFLVEFNLLQCFNKHSVGVVLNIVQEKLMIRRQQLEILSPLPG